MRITHTQIKTLTSHRMNRMGCIAHKHYTTNSLLFCQDLRQWKTEPLTGFLELSGTIAIRFLQGIEEMLVIFISQPFSFSTFFYWPDHGTAIFARQWQQCQRP